MIRGPNVKFYLTIMNARHEIIRKKEVVKIKDRATYLHLLQKMGMTEQDLSRYFGSKNNWKNFAKVKFIAIQEESRGILRIIIKKKHSSLLKDFKLEKFNVIEGNFK